MQVKKEGAGSKEATSSRWPPVWVVFPWLLLAGVNLLGGGYVAAWRYGWANPSGGGEDILAIMIICGVLSVFLVIVASAATLIWRSRRKRLSKM